ncbi:MAG: hypothetical protein MSIBF_00855 [Candidatus Altiarchaeales archaeon IMC4]|nr:MAG: hypothetical protein MSIBF_00855 [Candidatus Altiarchaeales archaeon IMC4]
MAFTLKPAQGDDFVDREQVIAEMVNTLSDKESRVGFALYGKRRVGKTSILKETKRLLKDREDIVVIYFSLFELAPKTVPNFVRKFSSEVLEAYKQRLSLKYRTKDLMMAPLAIIRKHIGEMNIGVKVGEDIEFLLTFNEDETKDYGELIKRAFDLPEKLAGETKTKCVLLIDEFPLIIDLKNGSRIGEDIIGVIRTVHEEQKNTAMCICGSIRKTMETVVLSSASPFYRQFISREISPFEKEYVGKLLKKNIKKEVMDGGVDRMYSTTEGFPFYVQLLGKKLEFVNKDVIGPDDIESVVRNTLEEEGDLIFMEEFNALSPNEQKIIISMAHDKHSPKDISAASKIGISTTSTYLLSLQEKGAISKDAQGIYSIDDPMFRKWVCMKYDVG